MAKPVQQKAGAVITDTGGGSQKPTRQTQYGEYKQLCNPRNKDGPQIRKDGGIANHHSGIIGEQQQSGRHKDGNTRHS
eukprot:10991982-Ditylum_brightwellii.AAC.1